MYGRKSDLCLEPVVKSRSFEPSHLWCIGADLVLVMAVPMTISRSWTSFNSTQVSLLDPNHLPRHTSDLLLPDWYSTFYDVMKCYRYGEEVRAWLEDADEDIREVSEDFLDTYGRKFWLRAGNSNRQDKKYKHFWFNWKDDEHK